MSNEEEFLCFLRICYIYLRIAKFDKLFLVLRTEQPKSISLYLLSETTEIFFSKIQNIGRKYFKTELNIFRKPFTTYKAFKVAIVSESLGNFDVSSTS